LTILFFLKKKVKIVEEEKDNLRKIENGNILNKNQIFLKNKFPFD